MFDSASKILLNGVKVKTKAVILPSSEAGHDIALIEQSLPDFAATEEGFQQSTSCSALSSSQQPFDVRPVVCGRSCACADHEQGDQADDGDHDKFQYPSIA